MRRSCTTSVELRWQAEYWLLSRLHLDLREEQAQFRAASPQLRDLHRKRLQPLKHINKPITWLASVVIVLSMSVLGPLLVSAPVGGGEAHAAGPGAPTCVDREVFSSNEFFSITTSRSISITRITTSFALLCFFDFSDLPEKVFEEKKENLR